jgi:hypothetical protein
MAVVDALLDECFEEDTPALATTVRSVEIDSLGDDFPIITPLQHLLLRRFRREFGASAPCGRISGKDGSGVRGGREGPP